jgi:DNA polymerase-3 subunit delta'
VSGDPFAGLVGNEAARARLSIALRRPSHAYLLLGRPGYGVAAHARRFAAALAGLPERSLESGHPDLLEVRPEGTQIRIDQVRELWRDIQLRPFSAERRVYLIWDAETMPEVVQHALLKSIEEPPAHAVVVLVCAQPHRLLATVRSRCEVVRFAPLAAVEVATALGLGGPEGLALARASGGDLERARELLEGGEARDRRERYLALARAASVSYTI